MGISASDLIPLSQARANFDELAEEVHAGAEKVITKNGQSFIAVIPVSRLDYYHQLERERVHRLLVADISQVLDEVGIGNATDARDAIQTIKRHRGG